jgi:hypothetical protein
MGEEVHVTGNPPLIRRTGSWPVLAKRDKQWRVDGADGQNKRHAMMRGLSFYCVGMAGHGPSDTSQGRVDYGWPTQRPIRTSRVESDGSVSATLKLNRNTIGHRISPDSESESNNGSQVEGTLESRVDCH